LTLLPGTPILARTFALAREFVWYQGGDGGGPRGGRCAVVAVLVVSHGSLSTALLRTAEMIAGECPHAVALELGADESPEGFRGRLEAALAAGLEGGDGQSLMLTDLLEGTPHRVATKVSEGLTKPRGCAVVSGVNLAMVVDALISCASERDAQSLARRVASIGIQQVGGSLRAS